MSSAGKRTAQELDRLPRGRLPQGRLQWLGASLPAALLVLVLVIDQGHEARHWGVLVYGLVDETAHLCTAALALLALAGWRRLLSHRRFTVSALVASMAIDVDHIPLYAGVRGIAEGGRPFSHSLVTVAVFAVTGLLFARGRPVLLGIAVGVVLHLFRDLASGPGVPLWWPVSFDGVRVHYQVYAAALVALAVVATFRMAKFRPTA